MNAEPSSSRRLPASSDTCGFPLAKGQCRRNRQHESSWPIHWQLRDQHNPLNLKRFEPCSIGEISPMVGYWTSDGADQMPEWVKAQSQAALNMIAVYAWRLERGSM